MSRRLRVCGASGPFRAPFRLMLSEPSFLGPSENPWRDRGAVSGWLVRWAQSPVDGDADGAPSEGDLGEISPQADVSPGRVEYRLFMSGQVALGWGDGRSARARIINCCRHSSSRSSRRNASLPASLFPPLLLTEGEGKTRILHGHNTWQRHLNGRDTFIVRPRESPGLFGG